MGGALSSWFVPAPSASSLRTTSHLCSGSSTALQARYQELAAQLPQRGFEESALQHARESFALGADGSWRPRRYDEAPWSLPPNAVRVLALSISDAQLNGASRSVGEAALRAAADLVRQLPAGTKSWMPELSSLHATIFHPGLAPGTAGSPRLVAPSAQALDRELHTARRFASSVPANLTLVVDRLTVSPSGVMLLLLRPAHDGGRVCIDSLRAAAAKLFPDAATKQARVRIRVRGRGREP